MSRIFISGSSTGLGLAAADLLTKQGHQVVPHARNELRKHELEQVFKSAEAIVVGDLDTIQGAQHVAEQVNSLGKFDSVIHNAAVGYRASHRLTKDGLPHVFAVNTLATYILTALIAKPKRLVYLSSGMHHDVDANLEDLLWRKRRWNGANAYAETKLHCAMFANAMARLWPDVFSNSLEPGWVKTRMGGPSANDDMSQAHLTQAWLASSNDTAAQVSGKYFYHMKLLESNPQARDETLQNWLLRECESLSGIYL